MGGCLAGPKGHDPNEVSRRHSRHILANLQQEREAASRIHKLLLLGASRSGKSTVMKQLSYLHRPSFSSPPAGTHRPNAIEAGSHSPSLPSMNLEVSPNLTAISRIDGKYVQKFTISQMKQLTQSCLQEFKYTLRNESKQAYERIKNIEMEELELDSVSRDNREESKTQTQTQTQIAESIAVLWEDEAIKKTFANRDELGNSFAINDSCDHFFDDIKRIGRDDFVPNELDILYTHKPTYGIDSFRFEEGGAMFEVLDAGGMETERKKWIGYFDEKYVAAVIFVASLSCYNQFVADSDGKGTVNALRQTLDIFDNVVNSKVHAHTPIILFLNKSDVFKKKLKKYPITVCFKSLEKKNQKNIDVKKFDPCVKYIQETFEKRDKSEKNVRDARQIYAHVTCATDRDNVKHVFNSVQHICIKQSLLKGGLL